MACFHSCGSIQISPNINTIFSYLDFMTCFIFKVIFANVNSSRKTNKEFNKQYIIDGIINYITIRSLNKPYFHVKTTPVLLRQQI
jgi:hypothetical protein